MSPYLIIYPKNENQVKESILFAKSINKKVVARSGGHQYCGLSSGGQDTIVLSMNHFDKI